MNHAQVCVQASNGALRIAQAVAGQPPLTECGVDHVVLLAHPQHELRPAAQPRGVDLDVLRQCRPAVGAGVEVAQGRHEALGGSALLCAGSLWVVRRDGVELQPDGVTQQATGGARAAASMLAARQRRNQ